MGITVKNRPHRRRSSGSARDTKQATKRRDTPTVCMTRHFFQQKRPSVTPVSVMVNDKR